MAPDKIAGLVLFATFVALGQTAAAGGSKTRFYAYSPTNQRVPCQDHSHENNCTLLKQIGICADELGKFACPATCNLCLEDLCFDQPCRNGGTCSYSEVVQTDYHCHCSPNYTGKNCTVSLDPCKTLQPCHNGATCVNDHGQTGGYQCNCAPFYQGGSCDQQKDVCAQGALCRNGGTCLNDPKRPHGFSCLCAGFYTGDTCTAAKPMCQSQSCQHGGSCADNATSATGYTCTCDANHMGDNCEKEKGVCEKFPFNPCKNGGSCINLPGSYKCLCASGFTGQRCDDIAAVGVCDSSPCQNGGACIASGSNYTCTCTDEFRGQHCEQRVGFCGTLPFNPCKNGGTCESTTDGYFVCRCQNGYSGKQCDQDSTTTKVTDSTTTTVTTHVASSVTPPANACASLVCLHGGHCVISGKTARCACVGNYTGDRCQIDPCHSFQCQNSGTCRLTSNGTAECACAAGYSGTYCKIGPCHSFSCQNGGSCHVTAGKAACACAGSFTGAHCETRVCHVVDIDSIGCGGKQDVAILMSSGSRTDGSAEDHMKSFVKTLIGNSHTHVAKNHTNVAVGYYDGQPHTIHPLSYDVRSIARAIDGTHFSNSLNPFSSTTRLSRALDHARMNMLSGGRADADKVLLVILNDIDSNVTSLQNAALRLKNECISLNVVALINTYHFNDHDPATGPLRMRRDSPQEKGLPFDEYKPLTMMLSVAGSPERHRKYIQGSAALDSPSWSNYFQTGCRCSS